MIMKNIFSFSLILCLIFGCSNTNGGNSTPSGDKVEIILNENENDDFTVSDIKKYDEENMKKIAVEAIKEFLSLPYDANGVWTSYEKFYSKRYKDVLYKKRNVKNADEYVLSEPSLDFEFETKIDKIYEVRFEGNKVYIDADSSVYDRVNNSKMKVRQTFVMEYEDGKWVMDS